MCGTGYQTYPKFLPPTQNFFSPNSEVGREWQFCYSLHTSKFGEKNTYQNYLLKLKSKFLCIQSLVLEIKRLKQGYIFKTRPFYISFVLFSTFPSKRNIPRNIVFKKQQQVAQWATITHHGASKMFGDTIIYDAQRQITLNLKQ